MCRPQPRIIARRVINPRHVSTRDNCGVPIATGANAAADRYLLPARQKRVIRHWNAARQFAVNGGRSPEKTRPARRPFAPHTNEKSLRVGNLSREGIADHLLPFREHGERKPPSERIAVASALSLSPKPKPWAARRKATTPLSPCDRGLHRHRMRSPRTLLRPSATSHPRTLASKRRRLRRGLYAARFCSSCQATFGFCPDSAGRKTPAALPTGHGLTSGCPFGHIGSKQLFGMLFQIGDHVFEVFSLVSPAKAIQVPFTTACGFLRKAFNSSSFQTNPSAAALRIASE